MPGYVLLLLGGAALLAVLATVLAGRLAWARSGERNPESVGFVGAILNGLFIVILAFYTVLGWEDTGAADAHATTEAQGLTNVYWALSAVPQPQRDEIRDLIRDYTTEVAEREWPMLGHGESDPQADRLLTRIRTEVGGLPISPDEVKTARTDSLSLLAEVSNNRDERVALAEGGNQMALLLFIGTILGAVAMVCFPILVGITATARNVVTMALMASALALTCYAAFEISHPFQGWVGVDPGAFQDALRKFPTIP